ncbi:MAG: hypothetical protein Q9228_002012 [Teloschistes exilis]
MHRSRVVPVDTRVTSVNAPSKPKKLLGGHGVPIHGNHRPSPSREAPKHTYDQSTASKLAMTVDFDASI